jgi:hypothetical protein
MPLAAAEALPTSLVAALWAALGDLLALVEMAVRIVLMQHLDHLIPDLAAAGAAVLLDLAQV